MLFERKSSKPKERPSDQWQFLYENYMLYIFPLGFNPPRWNSGNIKIDMVTGWGPANSMRDARRMTKKIRKAIDKNKSWRFSRGCLEIGDHEKPTDKGRYL